MKDHNFYKLCYEVRAKKILEQYYGESYKLPLHNSDKPDIIDNNRTIGIEVTRSFFKNSAETSGLFENFEGMKKGEIPSVVKNRLRKLNADCFYSKKYGFYGVAEETNWVSIDEIFGQYQKKIAINYSVQECDLYMYSPSFDIYDHEDIVKFGNKIIECQKDLPKRFRFIYLDDFHTIFKIAPSQKDLLNFIKINENENHNINKETKNEVELMLKK